MGARKIMFKKKKNNYTRKDVKKAIKNIIKKTPIEKGDNRIEKIYLRKNDYKLIIITSVQYITEIYKSCYGEPRKQWMRRVEVITLKNNDDDELDIDAL